MRQHTTEGTTTRARTIAGLQDRPASAQQSEYGIAILAALSRPERWRSVYGGTVPHAVRQARRATNRRARAARRVTRR